VQGLGNLVPNWYSTSRQGENKNVRTVGVRFQFVGQGLSGIASIAK